MRAGMVGLAGLYWPLAIGRALYEHPGVQFVAAATLGVADQAIRAMLGLTPEEYAARFGLRLYSDAEEMAIGEHLDTVAIVTRHTEHAAWAERMAALGTDIFIPKTFATTFADAHRIVEAGRRHEVQIAVGPSARYLPPMMAAKQAVDEGRIGDPFAMRLCHHHGTIDVFHPNDWYRDPIEGGPELSLGWYGIDLMLHFMAAGPREGVADPRQGVTDPRQGVTDPRQGVEPVHSVMAQYGNFTSPDSPFMDCGRIEMRMASGGSPYGDRLAAFDMYFCNRVPYPSWQMEIVGPGGVVSIHRAAPDGSTVAVGLDGPDGYQSLPLPDRTPGWESFWIDDLLAGRKPAISAEEAETITRLSLAARESASAGVPVSL